MYDTSEKNSQLVVLLSGEYTPCTVSAQNMTVLYRMMIVEANMNAPALRLELGESKNSQASSRQSCDAS